MGPQVVLVGIIPAPPCRICGRGLAGNHADDLQSLAPLLAESPLTKRSSEFRALRDCLGFAQDKLVARFGLVVESQKLRSSS